MNHVFIRSFFTVVFLGIFGPLAKAGKQIQAGDQEHYGWLARIIVNKEPIRYALAAGLLVLTALAIYSVAVSA